jgi:hypothetical protein
MNTKLVRPVILAVGLLLGSFASLHAAEPPKEVANKIISSLEKGDYDMFVADADNSWKQRAPKGAFGGIANMMAPKLKGGYDLSYLGELKGPGGSTRTLWKLSLKATSEDMLVAVDLKDGKVNYFGFPK